MDDFLSILLKRLEGLDMEPSIKEFFLSRRRGLVYGAGAQAQVMVECAQYFHKNIAGLIVAENGLRKMEPHFNHVPLYRIDSLPDSLDRTVDVIVGVHPKFNAEITETLRRNDFSSLYRSSDWEPANRLLRDLFFMSYFDFHGFNPYRDANGNVFLQVGVAGETCLLPFTEEHRTFHANFSGAFNDIVFPSLCGDIDYVWEGPYEYGDIALHEGDVVFDLGANVGMFTAVAAAKGCRVYAFEPTPDTLTLLERTASPYRGVIICPYAIADANGKVAFTINADLESNPSTVSNSLRPRDGNGFSAIDVDAVSLDAFVEESGIDRVDFIKADIEGAERLMLAGAKRTLSRFAPKLALCTYHLPDDPETMERLILEANPEYVIEHKWSKLYAHCR